MNNSQLSDETKVYSITIQELKKQFWTGVLTSDRWANFGQVGYIFGQVGYIFGQVGYNFGQIAVFILSD